MKLYEKLLENIAEGYVDIRKFTVDEINNIIVDAININPHIPLVVSLLHNNLFAINDLLEEEYENNKNMKDALEKIKETYPAFYNDLAFLSFSMVLLKITEFLKNQKEVE